MLRRVRDFASRHPDWSLRAYRTPNGLRLLATHRPFDAASPEVEAFFEAVAADPVYRRMCARQRCFRARLTAKPWRIDIADRLRPRPGVWPVRPERLPQRRAWTERYDAVAAGYAACRFIGTVGRDVVCDELRDVVALHDRESRALEASLPIA